MSDYFDHVERSLREAVRERRHVPWYARLLPRRSRPALLTVAIVLGGGTALAATGALRTGASVSAEVAPTPSEREGTVIASTIHVLPLRVPDPIGGPPWGLRIAKTSRGLLCVEAGRVVSGRVGVIGTNGAFKNDDAFHPFSAGYLSGVGCGTEDARGDAFLNEQLHGIPASALLADRRYTSGGCYTPSPASSACPKSALRDVYFGLLGPDATSITRRTLDGGTAVSAAVAPYGAYLMVLPHAEGRHCEETAPFCSSSRGYTSSPTLVANEAITAVTYRNAPPCRLGGSGAVDQQRREAPHGPKGQGSCPAVGYVPLSRSPTTLTAAMLASPVTAHLEPARRYCERQESLVGCDRGVPPGYKPLVLRGPPETLLVVEFTARQPVTNFDSHYEIETTSPYDPRHPGFQEGCGGTFGPTQRNLRAGERVRFTQLLNVGCHGMTRVTVGYVTVNGPSGATPVPGLPGQSPAIPVGQRSLLLP